MARKARAWLAVLLLALALIGTTSLVQSVSPVIADGPGFNGGG